MMSKQCTLSESPAWGEEFDESFITYDWPTSSLDASPLQHISTPSVLINQCTINNLSQDVIAAGEEIDSIVKELWRTAITSETNSSKHSHHHSEPALSAHHQNEILLSVLKSNVCEDALTSVSSEPCKDRVIPLCSGSVTVAPAQLINESPPNIKNKHKCDKCDKCYSWLSDLVRHQKSHEGRLYSCFICKKTYSLKSDLSKHQRIHNCVEGMLCKHCGKSFYSMGDLHKHVRIHTGERPYLCNICKKSFSASDNYHKHVRTHSGEKPLICVECGQRFRKKSNLQQHRRIHVGEKPFQCDLCGLTFTQKTHMKNHLNTHSGIKPFSCLKCGQRFTRNSDLNRHSKRAHAGKTGNRGL